MERELNDAHPALFFNNIQDSGQRISYREFGDAPNDDLIELQTFVRRVRRGQRAFRDNLLLAYGSECSITGEGPEEVLEEIHIVPHAESGINELDNGLLMRADLHHHAELLPTRRPRSHCLAQTREVSSVLREANNKIQTWNFMQFGRVNLEFRGSTA